VRGWASILWVPLLLAACGSRSGDEPDGALNTTTSKAEPTEHAVIVHISNSTDQHIGLDMIEDPLIDAIETAGVGEFDGNEIGPDEALVFMYGPDADALWRVVEPVLRDANLGPGSYAVQRYGPPGAHEAQIDLG
jgi:hypothetical protein